MKRLTFLTVIMLVAIWGEHALAKDQGFLFGTITTEQGEEFTGRIRWDKNEGFWDDIIDATKNDDERYESRRGRRKKIRIFGLSITTDNDWSWSSSSSSQLRFGHIEAIIPRSRGRATVLLKSGEKIRFQDGSSDLGSGIRGIQLDSEDEGLIEFDWGDIDRVEFFPEPDSYKSSEMDVARLFGVVQTEEGEVFKGFICWDADEIYSTDILDGDEDGRSRKIRFSSIEAIEKVSRRACLVRRKSGREIELRGSNDVNSGNRGIYVIMKEFGQVKIDWDEFESLTLLSPPAGAAPRYDEFDGGERLRGTVTTEDGDRFTGEITWDNDERYSWEFLNGDIDEIAYDIEFSQIAKVERYSSRAALVTLRDGTILKLRDSNDVNDENKGIFIELDTDREIIELDWDEFKSVVFER